MSLEATLGSWDADKHLSYGSDQDGIWGMQDWSVRNCRGLWLGGGMACVAWDHPVCDRAAGRGALSRAR